MLVVQPEIFFDFLDELLVSQVSQSQLLQDSHALLKNKSGMIPPVVLLKGEIEKHDRIIVIPSEEQKKDRFTN